MAITGSNTYLLRLYHQFRRSYGMTNTINATISTIRPESVAIATMLQQAAYNARAQAK
jgi:hypothetical protein